MTESAVHPTAVAPREVVVPIEGMTCAGCVRSVEKALAGVPGVRSASANLTNQTATATLAREVAPQTLADAVRKAGYGVPTDELIVKVQGMTCASCVGRVEKALLAVPGVLVAEASLATESARVTTLAGTATPSTLVSAIDAAGYKAHVPEGGAPKARFDFEPILAVIGVVMALPFILDMALGYGFPARLQFIWATLMQIVLGARFYVGAFRAARARTANMDTLVALGTTAAWGLSVWLWSQGHDTHLYFEAGAVVIALVLLGKWLENRAKRRAGDAMAALARLQPTMAHIRGGDGTIDRPVDEVRAGQSVLVRPGERIPVDGIVRSGESDVDEALLTGESRSVRKSPGDTVTGGAINGLGLLEVEATTVGSASRIGRLIRLVERAQASKAPIQRLVDRIAKVFVPVVLVIAAASAVGTYVATGDITSAMVNAVSVLVISCPCALGLATPAAVSVAIGAGARAGLLIRDAEALDAARRIDTVVFDKTGTLTLGRPVITDIRLIAGTEVELLAVAGSAQLGSEHPLAHAVVERARADGIALTPPEELRVRPGLGLEAEMGGKLVYIGSRRLMEELGVATSALVNESAEFEREGKTTIWIAAGRRPALLGMMAARDTVRDSARSTIALLAKKSIGAVMLTGDNRRAAEAIARELGEIRVIAEVMPEGKVEEVERLRKVGHVVAMVGDGVNDGPALAAADVGIAIGGATEVAMEAAKVGLMRPDLRLVPSLVDLARRGHAKIVQNLFWAFVYNMVGIPLAAIGLLTPLVAGAAMAFSSVSVVANALTLRRWHPQELDR
ncbi:MAG: copper-translocating P-type ATPase [Alphaproteobacteria bacterium]|nr:copper-translocating P-type ATPase [Alphaproteobacteria bacterium]